jgi:allantoinase
VPSGVDEFPYVRRTDVEAALGQLRGTGIPLMVHAELAEPIDEATRALEVAGADPRRYATYLASRPPAAEDRAVALLYELAKTTSVPIHVVHLSSASALATLARARDEGVPLTAETAPHYLHFAAADVPDGATWYKCAPPIRDAENRERLWDALRAGLIGMVVSDHSPCLPALKRLSEGDFMAAWGGIAGLQFSLCATWTGAHARGFALEDVVRWMSAAPARHAGLTGRKGGISVGADADLVVFDPDGSTKVDGAVIEHRHKLTPYAGQTLRGSVVATYLRGEAVFAEGAVVDETRGIWLRGGKP